MNEPVHSKRPTRKSSTAPITGRTNDPERTMAEILQVATAEFASKGLSGARIDAIADATRTSKRMIYYYFKSKEGLYLAVLEDAYRRIRQIETDLHLEDFKPEEAMRKLVGFTVEYQTQNPDFIRLVMNENIHSGAYLKQSKVIHNLNIAAIDGVRAVYERGVSQVVFRKGLDPVDLHMTISALSVFNVANKHTFGLIFSKDFDDAPFQAQRRDNIVELLIRFIKT
ncbi:MAG: TetR/AcrR family transcriptional regulator [Limnohabitans sp.]|nr:TetR/AcrR family transcriptional regulator [Limnohabitans sp.]